MQINKTRLKGVYEIVSDHHIDNRGDFVKTFQNEIFNTINLDSDFKESFFSISKKNVLRGMHFQLPPCDHNKFVYVPYGKILDVVVDVDKNSDSIGDYYSIELSDENFKALYISKGYAHGFLTLSENTIVVYMTTTVYNKEFDTGVRWDSFGFDWGIENPIISGRDNELVPLRFINCK